MHWHAPCFLPAVELTTYPERRRGCKNVYGLAVRGWRMDSDENIERRGVKRSLDDDETVALGIDAVKSVERALLARTVKRAIDILLALAMLLALSPVMLWASIWIKFADKGPVFFKHKRVGRGGRNFYFYKFRTMVVDAEKLKANLVPLNEANGPIFKLKEDPRVTRAGKLLRKFSIDELPQLFNVLKGDMSLVGPRPQLPEEVAHYKKWQTRRLAVVPGITSLWAIGGRSRLSFEEWMRLDMRYIEEWSLLLDLKIIFATAISVFKGDGAY